GRPEVARPIPRRRNAPRLDCRVSAAVRRVSTAVRRAAERRRPSFATRSGECAPRDGRILVRHRIELRTETAPLGTTPSPRRAPRAVAAPPAGRDAGPTEITQGGPECLSTCRP